MTYTNRIVNGVVVPLTAQEIAEFMARDTATAAKSAPQVPTPIEKLAKLGLTVQELKDLLK